jgi:hypothetical protein
MNPLRGWMRVIVCLGAGLLFSSQIVMGQATGQSSANSDPGAVPAQQAPQQSLADMARKMRKDHPAEEKMTEAQTKEVFESVDKLFDFASEDTGFAKHMAVKRQMVGPSDIEKFTKDRLAKAEYSERFARAELTMKKFGLLPREFNLRDFLVKANGKQVAGLYDEDTKTISLLNTVSFEQQGPILAHELTHALQDQNFDLKAWARAGNKDAESGNDELSTARHAVVEGQAMVVYIDYLLAPYHHSMADTPGIVASMEEPAVQATIDTEMLHNAPMVLREAGNFPYRDGLLFEGEVLQKQGKAGAFAGVFAHPPRNTHEVLDPRTYLEHEKLATVSMPDVKKLVGSDYEVYDTGSFGELDVRSLLKQFGDRRSASELAAAWQGGAYVACKRKSASGQPTTADLALFYVSHWKNSQAADKFARFYATSVGKRYQTAAVQAVPTCTGTSCPKGAALVTTEEGPVIVEEWADDTIIVSESFDSGMAAKLMSAARTATPTERAESEGGDELSLRLYAVPAFRAFQAEVAREIREQLRKRLN